MSRRGKGFWILIGVAIPVLAIVAAGIYAGTRSDAWWGKHAAAILSSALERDVAIDGGLAFRLGRNLHVEVDGVRVANPAWSESPDTLRIGSLVVDLDLFSALGETLVVHRLEIDDVSAALERNVAGENNWTFGAASDDGGEPVPARKPAVPTSLPVEIGELSVDRATLTFSDPARSAPLSVQIDAIRGGTSNGDDEAFLEGSGSLQALPFELSATLGKLTSLLEAGPVDYSIDGRVGEVRLQGTGAFASVQRLEQPSLTVEFSGPDVTWLTGLIGAPAVAEGAFDARLDVEPVDRGLQAKLDGDFGTLDIDVELGADDLAALGNLNLDARLSGGDFAAFAELLGLPPLPGGAFRVDAALERKAGVTRIESLTGTVGEHRISVGGVVGTWPGLDGTRLDVAASGPDLADFEPAVSTIGLGRLPHGPYTIGATVEPTDEGLRIARGSISAGDYRATVDGRVTTAPDFRAELEVSGSGPDLSMVSRLAKIPRLPALPFEAAGRLAIDARSITLIGTSGTVGEHSVSADGPIRFSTRGPISLKVSVEGPSLQALLQQLGYDVIPAAAAFRVDGTVEYADGALEVAATTASLGPSSASATLSIPDLRTPTTLSVDVGNVETTDLTAALALVGVPLDLPRAVPARLSGTVQRTAGTTALSALRGSVGEINVSVDGAVGDPPDYANSRLTLDLAGAHLERLIDRPVDGAIPLRISGTVAGDRAYAQFDNVGLVLGSIVADVDGTIAGFDRGADTEIDVSVQAPNLDTIAAILGRPLPAGAVRIDGRIGGNGTSISTQRMSVSVGPNHIAGDLRLVRGEPPRLSGRVSSTYLDVDFVRALTGVPETAAPAGDGETANAPTGGDGQKRLIPDTPLDVGLMDLLDADVRIDVDELDHVPGGRALHGLSASVQLAGGELDLADLDGAGPSGGRVTGAIRVARVGGSAHVDASLNAQMLRLGLASAPDQDPATYPPTDAEVTLSAQGRSLRELAASLDGRVKVVQGAGRVSNGAASVLLSDVLYELFQLLNPFSKQEPTTRLDCAVLILGAEDGIADLQSLVVQTDKLTILSSGRIDLGTEKLDVDFRTQPRKGIGVSASMITNPWIKLGGTLAKPALVLDPARAAASTGAAVATGGISILAQGFWNRFFSARDPCARALERDAERQAEAAPAAENPE